MILKKLDQIIEDDLNLLKENEVLESKTIEYKEELHLNSRDERKEFLADASSFANASGGDLIIGIEEQNGLPFDIKGLDKDILDELNGKIEGLLRDGTEPRVHVDLKEVQLENSKSVLIIRIPKSWRSPHRILMSNNNFYSRNSNGKYQLDINEIRNAFNLTDHFTDRVKSFREDRLSKIIANEAPIILNDNFKTVIHIVPINAFDLDQSFDINQVDNTDLKLIYGTAGEERYNIDGILSYYRNPSPFGYVQLFKNGIIEAVDVGLTNSQENVIPSGIYEPRIIEAIKIYLDILNNLNVETPIYIFISLVGVKGYKMAIRRHISSFEEDNHIIDRDVLLPPETLIEDYDEEIEKSMKNCFDSIWNACGYSSSQNYDAEGNWHPI